MKNELKRERKVTIFLVILYTVLLLSTIAFYEFM